VFSRVARNHPPKHTRPSSLTHFSSSCRSEDESASSRSYSSSPTSPYAAADPHHYPYHHATAAAAYHARPRVLSGDAEPRDIVPRARPSSTLADGSLPELAPIVTDSSVLRSLAAQQTPPSPSSSSGSGSGHGTSSSTSFWPWRSTSPAVVEPASAKSPSLRRSGGWFSSPSTSAVAAVDAPGHHYYYDLYTTMARPLAPMKPGASARPKSIELIQPLAMGRWE
jgi:hypothetical protein